MLSSPAPLLGDLFSENIGKREVLAAEDLLDFSQCRRLLAVCKTVQGRFSDPELDSKAGITLLTAQSFQEVRMPCPDWAFSQPCKIFIPYVDDLPYTEHEST